MSVRVQTDDFDIAAECDALNGQKFAAGALSTFTGLVRGDDDLIALTLEHYPGMTEREITRHVEQAHARWPLLGTTVIHRVGRLVPGDRIVFVGVAAPHRQPAFEACEFLMDYLKTRAPFWKEEERAGGRIWVQSRDSDEAAAQRWAAR